MPQYRVDFVDAGLNLPQNFSVRATGNGLEIIDEFVRGKDIDVMIRTRDQDMSWAWSRMIEQVCAANSGVNPSKAMIDVKPANFIQKGSQFMYIDLSTK